MEARFLVRFLRLQSSAHPGLPLQTSPLGRWKAGEVGFIFILQLTLVLTFGVSARAAGEVSRDGI